MTDYATPLRDHSTLSCRSVDRIFLQGYVPGLQTPGLVARFLPHRGFPLPARADQPKPGRAVDNRPSAARDHDAGGRTGAHEGRREVDGEHFAEALARLVVGGEDAGDAGVVDHDGDPAGPFDSALDQSLDLAGGGDVGRHRQRAFGA
jgi:hypothetical protein